MKLLVLAVLAAVVVLVLWMRDMSGEPAQWDDPVTGSRFIRFEPATFEMGTPDDEPGRQPDEQQHRVQLTIAFYLADTEVTQAQWTRIMGENPSYFHGCGPACPVERVSWHDVQRFIHRLNARGSGGGYRLPTEAEWEFACRGGAVHPFGDSRVLSSRIANVHGHHPYRAPRGPHRGRTTPVREFGPNRLGLFDMAGNVWEWVQDEYCPYGVEPVTDPVRACDGARRVLRGGSWSFDAGSARCGSRYAHRPEDGGSGVGFRLAHDPF